MIPLFPKPSQQKQKRKYLDDDGVFRYPDGREVCCLTLKKGADEYQRRKRVAWENQGRRCSIGGEPLRWADAVVDHIEPRGMGGGARRDNQENVAAACALHNSQKGSKRNFVLGLTP